MKVYTVHSILVSQTTSTIVHSILVSQTTPTIVHSILVSQTTATLNFMPNVFYLYVSVLMY